MEFRQKKVVQWLLVGGLLLLLGRQPTAEAAEGQPDPLGFTVQAIRPDTQIEINKSYFFIETKPEVSQVLKVKLKGMKKEPVKVKAFVTNGVTGGSGNLEYEADIQNLDETLQHPLTEITSFSETEIVLENFEEKIIDVIVTPPKESYEGIKLGALIFELVEEEEVTKQAVASKYQYRVGLLTTETGEEYEDAKNLDLISAKLGLKLGRKEVSAVIHNPEPKIADNLKIEAIVTKKGSDNVLKKQLVENARMAPNSTYDFSIDWGLDTVKPGDYVVKVHAQNDQAEWNWQKDFSVSGESAKKLNEETPFQLVLPKWVPVAVVATIGAIILVVVVLTVRSSKWQQLLKEQSKKRKSRQAKGRKKRTREE
ncbi:WxL protein host-binding domain-containing protein [uncultured Vagococcus sp.]|uniref:DUF3324 domain-containing protein n=1 Tax=uncultured Vagococcus sp. TaxID=189676 RepID=UPI0028D7A9BB|nr:DUF3324 domain-containing protein [uncultured Vagococcus sp.]